MCKKPTFHTAFVLQVQYFSLTKPSHCATHYFSVAYLELEKQREGDAKPGN